MLLYFVIIIITVILFGDIVLFVFFNFDSLLMLCYAFNLLMAFDRLLLKGLLTYLLTYYFLPRDAMNKHGQCRRAAAGCLSVTFVYSVKTSKHFNFFHIE